MSFHYYCSHDKEHRLTPCIHELCRRIRYEKIDWGKNVRTFFKWGDNPMREFTEDDGA